MTAVTAPLALHINQKRQDEKDIRIRKLDTEAAREAL